MSEWNPSIVRVTGVEPHPNADKLDIAYIFDGYPCIISKGQYKVGDLVSYIPIDTIVPDTKQFNFLVKDTPVGSVPEKYRTVRAKRLRGVFSMGLIMDPIPGFEEGTSIVEHFNIKKWEEEEEENVPNRPKFVDPAIIHPPKSWNVPHYDIEGLRRAIKALYEPYSFDIQELEIVCTEKIHGANMTMVYRDNTLWVKTRNNFKDLQGGCQWANLAKRLDAARKLSQYPDKIFFGECYGQVGGFPYDAQRGQEKFRCFDVYDLNTMRYLDYDDACELTKTVGFDLVPELYRGEIPSLNTLKALAEGKTTIGNHVREGFVLKTVTEKMIFGQRFQFKFPGEGYLLKK